MPERFTFFRLLTPLPFKVSLSIQTFLPQFNHVAFGARIHQLQAHELGTAGY